ncbi:MAG: diguanylate cyclase [Thermodesulfobacteriota bacterium]
MLKKKYIDSLKPSVRPKVLECFYRNPANDEILIQDLQALIDKFGPKTYTAILHVLTHLELDCNQARKCWQDIIRHCREMSEALGREIKLRTAACDYFCSVNQTIKNPVVVELRIFEDTVKDARNDPMTGLYNRLHLNYVIKQEIKRSSRNNSQFSIFFMDLDDFKKINDNFGHLAGDAVLIKTAEAISKEIRFQDIAARYGGEEIVIVLPETNKVTSLIIAERIKSMVADLNLEYGGHKIPVTVSGGLATFPIDSTETEELIKCADIAMFQAKKAGKNLVALYSQNKRRYLRLDYRVEITVEKINMDDSEYFPAKEQAINISLSGLLFSSDRLYNLETKLLINLPLKGKNSEITLIGTVVRIEYFGPGQYDVGVAFLGLDESSKKQLVEGISRDLNLDKN